MSKPDFNITSGGSISTAFRSRGINSFAEACNFIKRLPYGRNANKSDLLTVFSDGCGTCSTKHALLKQLADENGFTEVRLMLGIYKMNGRNTPRTAQVLHQYALNYIPEAHNYLRYGDEVIDCTAATPFNFLPDLLGETEIGPAQITHYKIGYHKQYLDTWKSGCGINYSLAELWEIREACIAALADD